MDVTAYPNTMSSVSGMGGHVDFLLSILLVHLLALSQVLSSCSFIGAWIHIMQTEISFYQGSWASKGPGLKGPKGGPQKGAESRSKTRGQYCHCPFRCFSYLVYNRDTSQGTFFGPRASLAATQLVAPLVARERQGSVR